MITLVTGNYYALVEVAGKQISVSPPDLLQTTAELFVGRFSWSAYPQILRRLF
jgi:hypothetical protein